MAYRRFAGNIKLNTMVVFSVNQQAIVQGVLANKYFVMLRNEA